MAQQQHHVTSPTVYAAVYFTLLLLTGLTVWVASTLQLGAWEVPVALGIASVKTLLIGWIFMHLSQSSKLVWLIIAAGFVFFAIMISLTLSDFMTRGWVPGWSVDPVVTGR